MRKLVILSLALLILVSGGMIVKVGTADSGPSPGGRLALATPSVSTEGIITPLANGPLNWIEMNPAAPPSPRAYHAMTYDAESDHVILFGGQVDPNDFSGVSNDTWAYDYNSNMWTNMAPSPSPRGLGSFGLAYDSESDLVVLFGGISQVGPDVYHNETWTYDFNSNTWTNMAPLTSPSARCCHAMAYDEGSDQVVLYGGYRGTTQSDTWAYDTNSNAWTLMAPPDHPPALHTFGMTYNAKSDRIILFGGYVGQTLNEGDGTWAYDLNADNWTDMDPVSQPPARSVKSLAYDAESDRVILFGGDTIGAGVHDDTWAYDYNNNTWTDMNLPSAPPARTRFAMAYDAESDRVVAFSGWSSSFQLLDDTWAYAFEPNPPSAPLNLQAVAGDEQVDLSWEAPSTDAGSAITGYRVHRGTSSGSLALLVELGDVLSFVDLTVTNGATYYYAVSAVNGVGEGPQSSEVEATPVGPPSEPRDLQATSPDSEVELSWQAPATDGGSAITNYRIYRGTASGSLSLHQEVAVVLSFVDASVFLGQAYYYAVSAVNAEGEGPQSDEVPVTPTDTTEPSITITSPEDGAVTSSTTVSVSGTASDNVELEKVELSTNQASWVTATGTTSWSGEFELVEGVNTIYARATDSSGNTRTVSISVTVTTFPWLVVFIGVGAAAAVVVAIVIFLLLRRRGAG